MNLIEALSLIACFIYALMPFSVLYLFSRRNDEALDFEDIAVSALWGIVGFVLCAMPIAAASLSLYCIIHAVLCVPAIIWLARALRRNFVLSRSFRWTPVLLIVLALLVRLAPYLPDATWYGHGDMRFHNILANSIVVNDALPRTWEPFAGISVNYPLGGHLLAAFVSLHATTPVHTVLNVLLCLYGAMSTAMIYVLAMRLFGNRSAAAASAISYGFVALAGSLDYLRWGGMPNALGMLLLLVFAFELIGAQESSGPHQSFRKCPILIAAAIILTHHYSALAMFILAGGLLILSPLRAAAKNGVFCSLAGLLLALLILRAGGALPGTELGSTSVFAFYEHPISIREALMSMNLPFAIAAIAGLSVILRKGIPREMSLITAWATAYFAAFVLLEYVYRLGVFSVTDGRHFFTALTPSRLIADLSYPLSLAAGALLLQRPLSDYRSHFIAILCAAGLASCFLFFLSMQGAARIPGSDAAIEWISANAPKNTIVVGRLPHLEYRTWLSTSSPPIPASEARNHPDLLRMRNMTTFSQWEAYAKARGMECLYIMPVEAGDIPSGMVLRHTAEGISVCEMARNP